MANPRHWLLQTLLRASPNHVPLLECQGLLVPGDGLGPVRGPVFDVSQIDINVTERPGFQSGFVLLKDREEQLFGLGGVFVRAAERHPCRFEFLGRADHQVKIRGFRVAQAVCKGLECVFICALP